MPIFYFKFKTPKNKQQLDRIYNNLQQDIQTSCGKLFHSIIIFFPVDFDPELFTYGKARTPRKEIEKLGNYTQEFSFCKISDIEHHRHAPNYLSFGSTVL